MHFDLLLSDSASQICCCVRDIIKEYAAARSTKLSFPGLRQQITDFAQANRHWEWTVFPLIWDMGSPRATNFSLLANKNAAADVPKIYQPGQAIMMMANLMRRSKSVPFDLLLSYSAAFIPNLLLHRRKNEPRCALLASWSLASFSESLPQKENHGCPSVRPFVVESLLCCGRRRKALHRKTCFFANGFQSCDRKPR